MATSPARGLAYVLCFGYSPAAKHALRTRAPHHQFEMLGEAGVSNYEWHQYLDDYHRAVLACSARTWSGCSKRRRSKGSGTSCS